MGVYNKHPNVWTPFGGWYSDPKQWKRNTVMAGIGMASILVPAFMYSASIEQRPIEPKFPIPSQKWCKNFGENAYK